MPLIEVGDKYRVRQYVRNHGWMWPVYTVNEIARGLYFCSREPAFADGKKETTLVAETLERGEKIAST